MLRLEAAPDPRCKVTYACCDRTPESLTDRLIVVPVAHDWRLPSGSIALSRLDLDDEVAPIDNQLNTLRVEYPSPGLYDARHKGDRLLPSHHVFGGEFLRSDLNVIRRGVIESLRPENKPLGHFVTCMKIWYTRVSVSLRVFMLPKTTLACPAPPPRNISSETTGRLRNLST